MEYNQLVKNKGIAKKIIREVCQNCEITVDELLGSERLSEFVAARKEIAARLRRELKLSNSAIGRILHRDHTSITHYLRTREGLGK